MTNLKRGLSLDATPTSISEGLKSAESTDMRHVIASCTVSSCSIVAFFRYLPQKKIWFKVCIFQWK